MKHRAFAMAMILLFLSIFGGTAAAKTEKLRLNTPVSLAAGEYCFSFTPPVGGYYSFFSYDSAVEIVLRTGTETLSLAGEAVLLNSGTAYEILLACETDFVLEVMRAARGKSALEPIELAQNSYSKVIVRKGDVHSVPFYRRPFRRLHHFLRAGGRPRPGCEERHTFEWKI